MVADVGDNLYQRHLQYEITRQISERESRRFNLARRVFEITLFGVATVFFSTIALHSKSGDEPNLVAYFLNGGAILAGIASSGYAHYRYVENNRARDNSESVKKILEREVGDFLGNIEDGILSGSGVREIAQRGIESGYIDQEDYHLSLIEGKKRNKERGRIHTLGENYHSEGYNLDGESLDGWLSPEDFRDN